MLARHKSVNIIVKEMYTSYVYIHQVKTKVH